MTEQFELRFQDLLRHGDWESGRCELIGDTLYGGNKDTVVWHKVARCRIVLRSLFPDWLDPELKNLTRSERKQLSKFAREVVRLNLLKSAFPS